jgi:Na+/phosphate symporter
MIKLAAEIKEKFEEGILFSDKATKEIENLFSNTMMLLRNLNDGILTDNPTLKEQVKRDSKIAIDLANQYATEHEDRLIKGLCQMKASPIFLNMIDYFKVIATCCRDAANSLPLREVHSER